MTPEFVSANSSQSISGGWIMIAKTGLRYVELRHGLGLICRSTQHVQLVELTAAGGKGTAAVTDRHTDTCTEAAISTEEACRQTSTVWINEILPLLNTLLLQPDSRLFAVLGRRPGEGLIKASKGRLERARLSVSVAQTIEIPTAFHVVRHLPGGKKPFVAHSSTINKKTVLQIIALANGILSQAAIEIELKSFGDADVEADLGHQVDVRKEDSKELVLIRANRIPSAAVNVFVVGNLLNAAGTHGATTTDGKHDVLVDDIMDTHSVARTLAHEFGHVLDLDHPFLRADEMKTTKPGDPPFIHPKMLNLMGPLSENLTRKDVSKMRSKARQLPGA